MWQAVTPDPHEATTSLPSCTPASANRRRSSSTGSTRPSAATVSVAGRLTAPGTCPARGSTGSVSPRYRAPARASSSTVVPSCLATSSVVARSPTGQGRAAHADELDDAVGGWIAARPTAEVLVAFAEAQAAVAPIYDVRGIVADPQIQARGTILTVDDPDLGPLQMQNVLFKLSETPGAVGWAGTAHGAETNEVLSAYGYTEDELAELRRTGAI